jgi:hypothetical protein
MYPPLSLLMNLILLSAISMLKRIAVRKALDVLLFFYRKLFFLKNQVKNPRYMDLKACRELFSERKCDNIQKSS